MPLAIGASELSSPHVDCFHPLPCAVKTRMPSSRAAHSDCGAAGRQVVAYKKPYRGMELNTNFLEYDSQLVDEDPAGPDRPPDSRCRPPFSGGR